MRHGCAGRQFGRNSGHRKALLRTLVASLLRNEKIETTLAKAKEIRPLAEKMITLAKRGDLHARRQALSFINDEAVVKGLFTDMAPRFSSRNGGYTRIVRTRTRIGDAAPMAVIELVERLKKEVKESEIEASKPKEAKTKEPKTKASKTKEVKTKEPKTKASKTKEKEKA